MGKSLRSSIVPHVSEIYRCSYCKKEWSFSAVYKAWVCPECGRHISIRITTPTNNYECQRVYPGELRLDDIILLPESDHQILDIEKRKDGYFLAMKNYGRIFFRPNDILIRIIGFWQEEC